MNLTVIKKKLKDYVTDSIYKYKVYDENRQGLANL